MDGEKCHRKTHKKYGKPVRFLTMTPKKYRNRFKTIPGVTRFLRARKIKWNENIVLKEEIKIQKDTVWTHMKTNSILYYHELKTEEKNNSLIV